MNICPKCGFEPDWCEHCGPVLQAYAKDGTRWCEACLEADGYSIEDTDEENE